MRLVLVLALIHGLAPGLGEVVETVVHYAAEGHLAHSEDDQGDLGDQGHHHGCGATQHQCGCCASQSVAVTPPVRLAGSSAPSAAHDCRRDALASLHEPTPPIPPPIAS